MILSFHPCFEADTNIIVAGRDPGRAELSAIRAAEAVILPQGCRESLYKMAAQNCAHVFPDYSARFKYPGKTGQAELFKKINAPFPHTLVYHNLADFYRETTKGAAKAPLPFPFVFKFNWGGEGHTVFLIQSGQDFLQQLENAAVYERSGLSSFITQAYVPHRNRSLRVVVINRVLISYWRVQHATETFGTSLASGARVDKASDPHLQASARQTVKRVCAQTGINLAGFDILFHPSQMKPSPIILEVNYFFGRTGLGGSEAFYKLLTPQIESWLAGLNLNRRQPL